MLRIYRIQLSIIVLPICYQYAMTPLSNAIHTLSIIYIYTFDQNVMNMLQIRYLYPYRYVIVLSICYQQATTPGFLCYQHAIYISYRIAANVIPKCCRFLLQSSNFIVATSPHAFIGLRSSRHILTICYQSAINVLSICYRYAITMLPIYYQRTTNAMTLLQTLPSNTINALLKND